MQFVKFKSKNGNPRGIAVFEDMSRPCVLDQRNLELRIANLKRKTPLYDLSVEMAVLAAMKETDGDNL